MPTRPEQPATPGAPLHRVDPPHRRPADASSHAAHGEDRRRAAIAGHTGDASAARELLAHADAGVRATALGALVRCGALDAGALGTALADAAPAVRRRAAELLATADVRFDDLTLVPLLADPEPSVVEVASWAAGERTARAAEAGRAAPDHGVIDTLAAIATGHADALCREAAVAALGSIGDEAGLPAILAALGDRATVRRRAVIALAPFSGPEVDEALARALQDRDRQVRQVAEDLTHDAGT